LIHPHPRIKYGAGSDPPTSRVREMRVYVQRLIAFMFEDLEKEREREFELNELIGFGIV